MKYFVTSLTVRDGEHEHTSNFVIKGESIESVRAHLEATQEYEFGDEAPNAWLSFGDGDTSTQLGYIGEIPYSHFKLLVDNNYLYELPNRSEV